MGLDWNPGNRPIPGQEAEFARLFRAIQGVEGPEGGLLRRIFCSLKGELSPERKRQALVDQFNEISIPAFQVLDAPRVGFDDAATEWARREYSELDTDASEAEWLESMQGYYVIHLAAHSDGLPRYTNGGPDSYIECYSFRAQFLNSCVEVIGDDLLEQAFQSKPADEMMRYGRLLIARAEAYGGQNGVDLAGLDGNIAAMQELDEDTPEVKTDIVLAAGRWCIFWAERGHVLDAWW